MTPPGLYAAALSRQDGGAADGVHLLFEAPARTGYSIDGFDIERRDALREPKRECVTLTADEIDILDEQLALAYALGRIELRAGACPVGPARPPVPERTCVRFDRRRKAGPNPLTAEGATFTVFDTPRRAAKTTKFVEACATSGLDGGAVLQIDLPVGAEAVELVVCAAGGAAIAATGAKRLSRKLKAAREPQTVVLDAAGLKRVRITAAKKRLALISCCWTGLARAPEQGDETPVLTRMPTTMMSASSSSGGGCLIYDFQFPAEHDEVAVTLNVPMALAVAFRGQQAVGTASGAPSAVFRHRHVDRVVVYTRGHAGAITVCVDVNDPKSWARAKTIAKNVNFPVSAVNPSLASHADERQLADSRLLPGETYDAGAFGDATRLLGDAASVDPDVVGVWSTTLTRERLQDPFVEIRSWAYGTVPKLGAQWRRMLGLGYLDPGAGLTAGSAYDYRVSGRFRRRDVDERLLGFQTVPVGTTLPTTFALEDVVLTMPAERIVEMTPAAGAGDLEVTGRKGVQLKDPGFFGGCLRIELPMPVLRLALDVDPGHSLSYSAGAFSGAVPARAHAVLDFATPVDEVVLDGKGMLYGLRLGADPAVDPDDVLTLSEEILGVVYEPTADPDPPSYVGTQNLQTPPAVAPAAGHAPPAPLGFAVSWLPPGTAPVWPPDLAAAPPFDVLGFEIERRRVDTGGGWAPIAPDTVFLGSRGTQPVPVQLYPGQNVLAVFGEWRPPQPPVSPLMRAEDPLERTGADPPPGSTHQYRLRSTDAIGRRSAPAAGPVVRLEKHTPPPQPAGRQDTPPDTPAPLGVTARVLQASDPALSTADRALLGGAATGVVLEWGWTDEQRTRDPYTTEFRVYWDATPPDQIEGTLTGTATAAGTRWTIAAAMARAVATDAMAGRYVQAGARPFRVVANTAGTAITLTLAQSAIAPAVAPTAGDFVFQPLLDGSEQRPAGWERRSAVIGLTAADSYRHLLAETVTLDVAHPRARVWTGVSAADDQSYVADELPAAAAHGGRPGNESSIAPAPAAGRFIGRPTFTVPPPLPDVPETRTNEPIGEDVRFRLDLPALLAGTAIPAAHRLVVERLGLADVVGALGATPSDEIHLAPPAGAALTYTLGNPGDQAALLAEIRSGVAARVERRFLMDALLRALAGFETSWVRAADGLVPLAALEITLPSQAERYAVRVRVADALGNISAGAAIIARVLRVPSLRAPAPPALSVAGDATDTVAVRAQVRDAPDLDSLLVFSTPIPGDTAPGGELLRTPNRPDLYPDDGVRLRLPDGTLLTPSVVATSTGAVQAPDRVIATALTAGFEQQVAVWAATLTGDGVPSRLAGPSVAATGPRPLVVPALTVAASGGEDHATWAVPAVPAEVALQRNDGSGTWAQVSPWLPAATTSYALPGAGTRTYRLVLRASRDRHATGPAVTPS